MFWTKDKFSNKFLNFEEFCLSESIRPMSIDFGTDLKNKEWNVSQNEEVCWTFFKFQKYFYCVMIDGFQVGFATSEFFDERILKKLNKVTELFDFEERKTSSAASVFSFVFFVALQGIEEYNIPRFWFSAQNPSLGTVYSKMIGKNKYFMNAIENAGFEYTGEKEGKFNFRRKE